MLTLGKAGLSVVFPDVTGSVEQAQRVLGAGRRREGEDRGRRDEQERAAQQQRGGGSRWCEVSHGGLSPQWDAVVVAGTPGGRTPWGCPAVARSGSGGQLSPRRSVLPQPAMVPKPYVAITPLCAQTLEEDPTKVAAIVGSVSLAVGTTL